MARRTVKIDDFNGKLADDTHVLVLNKTCVVLDLTTVHGLKLEKLLEPYFQHGTPAPISQVLAGSTKAKLSTQIREWAVQNGYTVKDRGSISPAIVTAYNDAMHQARSGTDAGDDD